MEILLSILSVIAFISFVFPFLTWSWTNFNKTAEVFGFMRLHFILWSWLISWGIFFIDLIAIILIVI